MMIFPTKCDFCACGMVIKILPLIRLAALPTLIVALLFTVVLIILAFLGVGMFIGGLGLILLGIFFLAPYFWPILVIITLIILVMSFGSTDK
jgi:hypothetical protein